MRNVVQMGSRAEAQKLIAQDPELKHHPALALRALTADHQMHLE